MVVLPGDVQIDDPGARESAIVADYGVARAEVRLGKAGGVGETLRGFRQSEPGGVVPCGRIAEHRPFEAVLLVELEGQLRCVVVGPRLESDVLQCTDSHVWRGTLCGAQQDRIERAKKKQSFLQTRNWAAQFARNVGGGIVHQNTEWVCQAKIIGVDASSLERIRLPIDTNGSMKLVAAGLGDDLHDPARSPAILRLEAAGHHLNFLDEGEADAGTKRTVHTRVNSQAAESGVRDTNAIGDVLVFKPGGAANRGIGSTRAAAADNARSKIEKCRDASLHREFLVKFIVQVRGHGRGSGVHGYGRRQDFNRGGDAAGIQLNTDGRDTADVDGKVMHFGAPEAVHLDSEFVCAGDQIEVNEVAQTVADLRQ